MLLNRPTITKTVYEIFKVDGPQKALKLTHCRDYKQQNSIKNLTEVVKRPHHYTGSMAWFYWVLNKPFIYLSFFLV